MTWFAQPSRVASPINHVFGFGPFDVYAVGDGGVILHWDGQTWTAKQSNTSQQLRRVWGATSSSVWVVGAGGTFLNSVDGGTTWQQKNGLNNSIVPGTLTAGEYEAIWGAGLNDFWALEDGEFPGKSSAGFWHTTDGGNTWTQSAILAGLYSHMWGVTGSNIAAGGFGSIASILARYNGVGWTSVAEASGSFDGFGVFPVPGPSAHTYTVGVRGGNPLTGTVANWATDYSSHVYDVAPSAASWRYVHGSDPANIYIAGNGASASPYLIAKLAAAQLPNAPGTWVAQPLPTTLPVGGNGFVAIYADPTGYAVAVGDKGAIVAQPGTPLAVVSAIAVATNRVRVILATAPLAQSVTTPGDALNPSSWQISRVDTGGGFTTMSVAQIDKVTFDVTIYERFASYLVQHQVAAYALLDPFGRYISGATTATFQGVVANVSATMGARTAAGGYVLTDIANPPTPARGNNTGGGVRVISAGGDFSSESGNALLKKLIIRRLTTAPGGFFHLPTYGVGLGVKEKIRAVDIVALRKRIQDQVSLEPEVQSVKASVMIDDANNIVTIVLTVTTTTGSGFVLETQQPQVTGG